MKCDPSSLVKSEAIVVKTSLATSRGTKQTITTLKVRWSCWENGRKPETFPVIELGLQLFNLPFELLCIRKGGSSVLSSILLKQFIYSKQKDAGSASILVMSHLLEA